MPRGGGWNKLFTVMMCSRPALIGMLALGAVLARPTGAQPYQETTRLIGVHFEDDLNTTGGIAGGPIYTDVEALLGDTGGPLGSSTIAGNGGGWLIDVCCTDIDTAAADRQFTWAWQG